MKQMIFLILALSFLMVFPSSVQAFDPTALAYITILGPTSVNAGSSASYTVVAYDRNRDHAIVTSYSSFSVSPSTYVTMSGNVLTANSNAPSHSVTVTASYSGKYASKTVQIVAVPVLSSIAISGSSIIVGGYSANYTLTAYYSDGTSVNVTSAATFSTSCCCAYFSGNTLYTQPVDELVTCQMTATYSGLTATKNYIVNINKNN